jgi:hypothetical protein
MYGLAGLRTGTPNGTMPVWMLGLNMDQLRTELRWLRKVTREFPKRSSARNPDYLTQ